MNTPTLLSFALAAVLASSPAERSLAGKPLPPAAPLDLQQQVLNQGPMLLGNLRKARENALRRDVWGMAYYLQEARRLLDAMTEAERTMQPEGPAGHGLPSAGNTPPGATVPLGEPLEVDRPNPVGRELEAARFEGQAGTIPLESIGQAVDRALAALNAHPPVLGAALLATEDALRQVHWSKGPEPGNWVAARDQALEGFALALDSNPKAQTRLREAHKVLTALPGGEQFARRLAAILAAPAPNLGALSALVRDLDMKVSTLRQEAELGP